MDGGEMQVDQDSAALPMMSRYEMARVVGLRALQLEHGAIPGVHVESATLCLDPLYVAARELLEGKLDVQVLRPGHAAPISVSRMRMPRELFVMLDTRDGGDRRGGTVATPA